MGRRESNPPRVVARVWYGAAKLPSLAAGRLTAAPKTVLGMPVSCFVPVRTKGKAGVEPATLAVLRLCLCQLRYFPLRGLKAACHT